MIDPRKLKAYMQAPFPLLTPPLPADLTEEEHLQITEALEDDMSEEAQTMRKLSPDVGYMELNEEAGAFSCGNCKYTTQDSFCGQVSVRAYVSAPTGCCNKFSPATALVVFPPDYKTPPDMNTMPSILR